MIPESKKKGLAVKAGPFLTVLSEKEESIKVIRNEIIKVFYNTIQDLFHIVEGKNGVIFCEIHGHWFVETFS